MAKFLSSVAGSVQIYLKVDEATSSKDDVTPGMPLLGSPAADLGLRRRAGCLFARGVLQG